MRPARRAVTAAAARCRGRSRPEGGVGEGGAILLVGPLPGPAHAMLGVLADSDAVDDRESVTAFAAAPRRPRAAAGVSCLLRLAAVNAGRGRQALLC